MKDLRLILPLFLLIVLLFALTGCDGISPVIPEPGATEADVSGQILMPLICCLPLPQDSMNKQNTDISCVDCDETELWGEVANAVVELRSAEKGKCNKVLDSTFTDVSGYYEFNDVEPGLYIVTAYCSEQENDGYFLKDVVEKVSEETIDAGIPDCDSTALALVIEKINGCYNDWYECFNQYTQIYQLVTKIADAIGEVDIPAIESHEDFGVYTVTTTPPCCDADTNDLVDLICQWDCCLAPGVTENGGEEDEDNPAISIDKVLTSADPDPAEKGSLLTYTVTVTNIGDVTLNNVTVNDPMLDPSLQSCPTLAVGATCVLVGTYTVTQADVDAGEINNTATGDSDETDSVQDSETVLINQNPAIEVTKEADVVDSAGIGDTITYSYEVTNTGNVTLTNVTAVDNLLGAVTLSATELAPGDSATGSLQHVVIEGDLPGPIDNRVDAEGTAPDSSTVTDSASESVDLESTPAISIDKVLTSADPDPAEKGSLLTYTVTVTNIGDVTLNNVTVNDPMLDPSLQSCPTLAVGATCVLVGTYTVTQADVDAGEINNTATGDSDETDSVQDSETVLINQNPAIEVTKEADVVDSAGIGDTITYSYEVTNTGNVTLTNVTAVDNLLGAVTLSATELAPGDSATGSLQHVVIEGDLPGPIDNRVDAEGTAPDSSTVTDSASESVDLESISLTIKKIAGGASCGVYDTPYPGTDWEFTITGPNAFSDSFTLGNNGEKVYPGLAPGSYIITETQTWGYNCAADVSGATSVTGQNPVTIEIADKADVTAIFTNTWGFDESGQQHLLVSKNDIPIELQNLVENHTDEGVLATIRITQVAGNSANYPIPYFKINLKTHSENYSLSNVDGWCITKNLSINQGKDYKVIVFPATTTIEDKIENIWGIFDKDDIGTGDYRTVDHVQKAIWKFTDEGSLTGKALNLYNYGLNNPNSNAEGIIIIPVENCGEDKASGASILSREIGISVDKNR